MPDAASILAQQAPTTPAPVQQIRTGFGLLVILVALGVMLIVIALGLTMANRKKHAPRVKKRHPGPKIDAWRESAARVRVPTAWELEKGVRTRNKPPRRSDGRNNPDAPPPPPGSSGPDSDGGGIGFDSDPNPSDSGPGADGGGGDD